MRSEDPFGIAYRISRRLADFKAETGVSRTELQDALHRIGPAKPLLFPAKLENESARDRLCVALHPQRLDQVGAELGWRPERLPVLYELSAAVHEACGRRWPEVDALDAAINRGLAGVNLYNQWSWETAYQYLTLSYPTLLTAAQQGVQRALRPTLRVGTQLASYFNYCGQHRKAVRIHQRLNSLMHKQRVDDRYTKEAWAFALNGAAVADRHAGLATPKQILRKLERCTSELLQLREERGGSRGPSPALTAALADQVKPLLLMYYGIAEFDQSAGTRAGRTLERALDYVGTEKAPYDESVDAWILTQMSRVQMLALAQDRNGARKLYERVLTTEGVAGRAGPGSPLYAHTRLTEVACTLSLDGATDMEMATTGFLRDPATADYQDMRLRMETLRDAAQMFERSAGTPEDFNHLRTVFLS